MLIETASGMVPVNKRTPYAKWLTGWKKAGAWTGWSTLEFAWRYAKESGKPEGCSWEAYGFLMAREQGRGRELAERERKENE